MTCPHCAGEMDGGEPWLCRTCLRHWWAPELTEAARALYRPRYQDFGKSPAAFQIQVEVREAARQALGAREI